MTRTVRIGNAGGYWGDDVRALRRQLEGGPLDYVSLDYLAEVTMSILQRQRAKDPALGYATDFVDQMRDCLPLLMETGATVITNAGGVNPEGLGHKLVEVARELGLRLKVGVVSGDDILGRLPELRDGGDPLDNMETGAPLAPHLSRVSAANVYLGAEPVVRALEMGCRVVVTGRVTDTGITLAPLIHEFGWDEDDWDRLAAGIVAGHVIECGTQATGGNLTDWRDVPTYDRIGYPIVEVSPDGSFVVTKHPRTGGLVSEKTVKEQLVYEMGDPRSYISPDVVARFDTIRLEDLGRDRVRVSGVQGTPRPENFKVSMAYQDGWKAVGTILVSGPEATAKAETLARAFWKRVDHRFAATHTSVVGTGSIWPETLGRCETDEVLLRLGVRDHDRAKVHDFGMVLPTMILSGPSGLAVTGGRPKPSEVVAYWPALIRRSSVAASITALDTHGPERREVLAFTDPPPPRLGAAVPAAKAPPPPAAGGRTRRVKLRALAYARSGDKGDTCNIGVLCRSPELYAWLRGELKPAVVRRFFKGVVLGRVTRHEAPNLLALNFLLERTLGGGGTVSLMLDPQGKTLSQALLEMELDVPARLVPRG
jgi:hypothetical protein